MILIFVLSTIQVFSEDYLLVKPRKGDGIFTLLRRYDLPQDSIYIKKFIEINKNKTNSKAEIFNHYKYQLPVILKKFDGVTIRTSLGISNYKLAKEIQDYNLNIVSLGLKKSNFKIDKQLWVPFHYLNIGFEKNFERKEVNIIDKTEEGFVETIDDSSLDADYKARTSKEIPKSFSRNVFGKKYRNIKKIDNQLSGLIFFLDPGHGGPDPGAIGNKDGIELTEDEYAYDITLRLAYKLLQHGANVFLTILDSTDGIRDEKFLKNNTKEYFGNGELIKGNPKERLQRRIDYINSISPRYKKKNQRLIVIHVDSRIVEQRIDVFFYFKPGDSTSKNYANKIMDIIGQKYADNQPGRGYDGNVSDRNLFMLRYSPIIAVYLELGNIQNPKDQVRFLDPNNRQAIANWICSGIIFNEKGNRKEEKPRKNHD
jgi:N-acetylmuramoyl-L-alanine amidase